MKALHVLLDGGSVDRQLRKIDREARRGLKSEPNGRARDRRPDERRPSNRQRQELLSWS